MRLFGLLHLECGYEVLIDVEIQVQQRQQHDDLGHFVEMIFRDVSLKFVSVTEDVHGHEYGTGSHQEGAGDEIGTEVGAVPARAVGRGEQP